MRSPGTGIALNPEPPEAGRVAAGNVVRLAGELGPPQRALPAHGTGTTALPSRTLRAEPRLFAMPVRAVATGLRAALDATKVPLAERMTKPTAQRPLVVALSLLLMAAAPCDPAVTAGGTPPARWDAVEGGLTEATRLRIADRYPLCIYRDPIAADLDVTLRFRPLGGRMDRAGGIAVRLQDPGTYYVLRANAAEDNVRLYHVTRGRRVQFAGTESLPIALGAWHTLRLRLDGDRFMAWLDDKALFEARDGRIPGAGRVALWSIADSQTVFETPRIEVLR